MGSGTLVYTDPVAYASNSCSNTYNLLPAGDYEVIVTDAVGCVDFKDFTIGCQMVNSNCVASGPYDSYNGPGTSPHHFTTSSTQPTSSGGCNDGTITITNHILGDSGNGVPTDWSIELLAGAFLGFTVVVFSGSTLHLQGGSETITNLAPSLYLVRVTDDKGCVYSYGAFVPACASSCSSSITPGVAITPAPSGSAPWPAGSCSSYPADPSAFYGHIGNGTLLKAICTDRCENTYPDNTIVHSGMYSHQIGCFPTDVDHMKVKYYAYPPGTPNACGPLTSLALVNPSPSTLLYDDPNLYYENADGNAPNLPPTTTVVWDDINPNAAQMSCGPKDGGVGSPDTYRFYAIFTCYDASGNIIPDGALNDCTVRTITFDVPCGCTTTTGGSGWNCSPGLTCLPHTPSAGNMNGTYSSLFECLNGGPGNNPPACQPSLAVPGCLDPSASNYDPNATHDCLGNTPVGIGFGDTGCCIYPPCLAVLQGPNMDPYNEGVWNADPGFVSASTGFFNVTVDTSSWPNGSAQTANGWKSAMHTAIGITSPPTDAWQGYTSDDGNGLNLLAPSFNADGELVLHGHTGQSPKDAVTGVYQFASHNYSSLPNEDDYPYNYFQLVITIGDDIDNGDNGWAVPNNTNTGVLFVNLGPNFMGVTAGITVERGPLGYNNSNYPNTPDMVLDSTVNYTGGIQPGDVITYGFYSTGSQQLVGTNPVVEYISVGVKSNEVQHISIKSICLVRSGT